MSKKTKLTIEDILKAKKAVSEKENLEFYSESINCTFEFEKINPAKIHEVVSQAARDEIDEYAGNCYLIYLSCPILRSKELAKEYEINGAPYDIVDKVFNSNIREIGGFASQILQLYGFVSAKVEEAKK